MSSIYKKGRDGYYYYQAYVFNKKTGKKDKRIFHSLGTKDHNIALSKQKKIDADYVSIQSKKAPFKLKGLSTTFIFSISIVFLSSLYFLTNQNNDGRLDKEVLEQNYVEPMIEDVAVSDFDKKSTERFLPNKKMESAIIKEEPLHIDSTLKIPNYTIERVVDISGAFEQGKIFLTVDKRASSKELLQLCDSVKSEFNEFSNIIICIYNDTIEGKNWAQGKIDKLNQNDKNRSWRVLYTFNDVEGTFFNDNPTGYLGAF